MTYLRYELLRTLRDRRSFLFSLAFPLILYLVIAAPIRDQGDFSHTGISAPLYFMVSLAAFGTMTAALSLAGRIAAERSAGWTRQLRITPLPVRSYFRAKVLASYGMALISLGLLYAAGVALGVHLSVHAWLEMTGLLLLGLIPFAALGVLLGHLLTAESAGPAIGGLTALLALLGGTWFAVPDNGFLHSLAQELPSYWLVRASRTATGGHAWTATGWIVMAAWTAVAAALAAYAYRRDTRRL